MKIDLTELKALHEAATHETIDGRQMKWAFAWNILPELIEELEKLRTMADKFCWEEENPDAEVKCYKAALTQIALAEVGHADNGRKELSLSSWEMQDIAKKALALI